MKTLTSLSLCALLLALLGARADAEDLKRLSESRPIAADGTIEVSNVAGSIRVIGDDVTEVRINAEIVGDMELRIEGNEQRLRIEVPHPKRGYFFGTHHSSADLTLTVPHSVNLNLDAVSANVEVSRMRSTLLEASTISGELRVDADPLELRAQTVSGDLDARGLQRTEQLVLKSVSGDVNGSVQAREIRLETVSGDIVLSVSKLGVLELDVVSGDAQISIGDADAQARFTAGTVSGDLTLYWPPNVGIDVDAEAFSGDLDFPFGKVETERYGPGSRLRAQQGDGTARVRLNSMSGTLTLRQSR